MIRKLLLLLAISCSLNALFAQDTAVLNKWSDNTALLMPAGKWESGIIQPFRYGINNKLEVFSNVLMLPLIPGAGIKIGYDSENELLISSEHSVAIPTPFLNFISRKGIGGILSPEYEFLFILSVHNSLLVSRKISPSAMLSVNGGFTFSLQGDKPDPQATIDLPVFYPRMAHYYEGATIHAGAAVKGKFASSWFYEENVKTFFVTRDKNNFFLENSGTIMWAVGKSLRIRGGYILAYGKYPYRKPAWQLWPTLDLVFGSKL